MRHAVILAGGGGTRLWPASRRTRPKQFLPLGQGGESLLATTVGRLTPLFPPERIWIVTATEHANEVAACLPQLAPTQIVVEPQSRNTAAAAGLACVHTLASDPNATIAILPADHHIRNEEAFLALVTRAFDLAEKYDAIVTLGIRPTRAEPGFGYLELGEADGHGDAFAVSRFVEKPDQPTAEAYLASGRHLWNAGMFFCKAARLSEEIDRHLPELGRSIAQIRASWKTAGHEAARAATVTQYSALPSVSIDHGIMEKTDGILVLPTDIGWSDVGSWAAVFEDREPDSQGNVVIGPTVAKDAAGNLLVSEANHLIAVVGVSDLVVVKAGNAVLVMPRARAQDVREVVSALEKAGLGAYL